jgi:hypothetical protein
MKRRKKPVTKDLIRKYYGKQARIRSRWFADGYKVRTATGEVLISDDEATVVIGGDDMYRAATLLMHEARGGFTAYGSREEVMTWLAHGEACGVNVRPGIKRGWFWRTVFACLFGYGVMMMLNDDPTGLKIALFAAWVWWLMARSAKRRLQQFANEVGFSFPRVHGMTGAASDDDLERGGWL